MASGAGMAQGKKGALGRDARRRTCFAFKIQRLGRYTGSIGFTIKLDTTEPIRQRKRRWSPDHEAVAREKCQELLGAGLIVRAESPHAAATVMAKKVDLLGEKGALRMCGDYKWLKRRTERDSYPMPFPEEIFDKLGGSKWFSTLDLRQGFNQTSLSSKDQPKMARWPVSVDSDAFWTAQCICVLPEGNGLHIGGARVYFLLH